MKFDRNRLRKELFSEEGLRYLEKIKREYERVYAGKPVPCVPYRFFKNWYETGNRSDWENAVNNRTKMLNHLMVLSLSDDGYIGELEECIAALCDTFDWTTPGLIPDTDRHDYGRIDLVSAETAFAVAECFYIFNDKLCSDIKARMIKRLEERIKTPFETRSFWWEDITANWVSVCSACIGCVYLLVFPSDFPAIKDKIFGYMRQYLTGINPDGVCAEGIGYWDYGFGYFMHFADMYYEITGERFSLLDDESVFRLANFANYTRLYGDVYVPFEDGGKESYVMHPALYGELKSAYGKRFSYRYSFENPLESKVMDEFAHKPIYAMGAIASIKYLRENKQEKEEEYGFKYFDYSEWFINKKNNYEIAAKCGNNKEFHNHNDVGCFELIDRNGKIIVCDPGCGKYTLGYHLNDELRYAYFVCGSQSHSVPLVGGAEQCAGEKYKGSVLNVSENLFESDISGAYPIDGISLIRSLKLEKNKLRLTDAFRADGKTSIVFRFTCITEPQFFGGYVNIGSCKLFYNENLSVSVEKVTYDTPFYDGAEAFVLKFESEPTDNITAEFLFDFSENKG